MQLIEMICNLDSKKGEQRMAFDLTPIASEHV
jgi:hypothetical protein